MAKDMTLLWGSGSTPCWRIQITLEEKQLQGYNQKLLSFYKMEHKSQEVLGMNPRGQVQTFKCGKHILNESYAACFFLEDQYNQPDFDQEHSAVALHSETMAKDMTLMWVSGSVPCWRVMIMLEEKQLQGYNHRQISIEDFMNKTPELFDFNLRGQVPSFKHGNIIVNESYGACFYLESKFKNQGTKLIPDDTDQKALMYQRMFEGPTFYQKSCTK